MAILFLMIVFRLESDKTAEGTEGGIKSKKVWLEQGGRVRLASDPI